MRVLVIDEELPYPPDSGKRIRTLALLRRLARSFSIALAYHESAPPVPEAVRAFAEAGITLQGVPRRRLHKQGLRFAWDLARNAFLRAPYMVMAHRTRAMRAAVGAAVAAGEVDLVHVEWTPLVANVPPDVGAPVVIAAHNVETQIWERYLENERHLARRAYVALQVRKVARFEREALRRADAVVAVSEADAARIRAWTGRNGTSVVPNGVDAAHFAPRPDLPVEPESALFVGALDWRPNLDAVTYFLDAIWPPLRRLVPGATFTVVGRHPPPWLVERVSGLDGVRLESSVPDVRPFVARAAVSIVPLRIGGGSRLKICEALAMQRPVVSTSVGAEGLDLGDGLQRADDPEGFARAVADVFARADDASAMAARGRERVLERYEWDRIAPRQAEAWRRAAGEVSP